MAAPPSLLFCVGEQYYKFHEFVDEARQMGVSKRIPMKSIPPGLVVGVSKILVAHPKAIIKVTAPGCSLLDLALALLDDGLLTHEQYETLVDLCDPFWTGEELRSDDFVPEGMFHIAYAFSQERPERQRELEKDLGLAYCMGVFGYAPFGGFEYVVRPGEEALPEDLKHLEGYVEPVKVEYTDSGEDE